MQRPLKIKQSESPVANDVRRPTQEALMRFMDTIDEFLGKSRVLTSREVELVEPELGSLLTWKLDISQRSGQFCCATRNCGGSFEKARGYKIERENYIADILGKNPVAPDVGKKKTIVTPIDKQTMEYRSPLGQYEEEDYDERKTNGYRNRYNKKFKTPGNRSIHPAADGFLSREDMS
ncbi:hypothetical protein MSG28_009627 [Choristoneura fumiferana]|uniref:Uncharacterized protein n=1 Tax=Choristoneura fumiferana TaxID=7141 RepID=A0ACC0JC03_CHOFU|nr:hypothetical protein MSG28_009627 [Choristoneura fumiferana]